MGATSSNEPGTRPAGRPGPGLRGSPRLVALVAALGWILVIAVIARCRWGSDFRALLIVNDRTRLPAAFATIPTVGPSGYDGSMYAALATDPLLRRLETPGYLDTPWYRATRVLVPLLAWTLALGHAPAAVVLYQLLCWGLAIGAVFLLARWLAEDGRSPWWALAAAGGAGMASAMLRTTPDAAALAFVIAALFLHERGAPRTALACAVAAVLARETSVLAALAVALVEARRRRFGWAVLFAGLPLGAGLGWQVYLRSVLGRAFDTGAGSFGIPFAWLPAQVADLATQFFPWEAMGILAVLATAVAFLVVLARPARWDAAALAFLGFAGLGLVLSRNIYCETWAYGRALIAVPFLATVVGLRERAAPRRWALLSVVLLYLAAGVTMANAEAQLALQGRGPLRALREGTPGGLHVAGGNAAPAPVTAALPPLWVVPAASVEGRLGAVWRTRLEIANPGPRAARVRLELFGRGDDPGDPPRAAVEIQPHETRRWPDAVDALFGRTAAGAIRVLAVGGRIAVRGRTVNASAAGPEEPLLPALPETDAVRAGGRAAFAGLVSEPDIAAGVRTNVGVLNVAAIPIRIRITALDGEGRRLGEIGGELGPHGFTQIDDVFARFKAAATSAGRVEVTTPTRGGAFLAYASVIRGPRAQAEYLFPQASSTPSSR